MTNNDYEKFRSRPFFIKDYHLHIGEIAHVCMAEQLGPGRHTKVPNLCM